MDVLPSQLLRSLKYYFSSKFSRIWNRLASYLDAVSDSKCICLDQCSSGGRCAIFTPTDFCITYRRITPEASAIQDSVLEWFLNRNILESFPDFSACLLFLWFIGEVQNGHSEEHVQDKRGQGEAPAFLSNLSVYVPEQTDW